MLPDRIKRVEELVKENVAFIIQRKVKDPRLGFVTITDVEVSRDLRNAKVFFTLHDESEENMRETSEALEAASGFIRRVLGKRIELRHLPTLNFIYDNSLTRANRIENILKEIKTEEKPEE